MKRATRRASFTPAREESPVYAIIFRSFSPSFFSFLSESCELAIRRFVYLSRCQLGRVGLRNRARLDAEKRRSRATATRISHSRRSQQVLSSERRHRRVKKFAATAKEDGENAFVSGFHVRVKLDNGQRASRMISDAYCIRSDDDATTTITTTRRFFPPPPPPPSPRVPHPSPLFPSSAVQAFRFPAPRATNFPSLFLSFFLLFLSPLLTRNLLLFLSTLYNSRAV